MSRHLHRVRISGATVVSMDDTIGVVEYARLLVEGERIVSATPRSEVVEAVTADEMVGGRGEAPVFASVALSLRTIGAVAALARVAARAGSSASARCGSCDRRGSRCSGRPPCRRHG